MKLTAEDVGLANWLKAKVIIEKFLKELCPELTNDDLNHNSSAIIARLASAEPPLFIADIEEMKRLVDDERK